MARWSGYYSAGRATRGVSGLIAGTWTRRWRMLERETEPWVTPGIGIWCVNEWVDVSLWLVSITVLFIQSYFFNYVLGLFRIHHIALCCHVPPMSNEACHLLIRVPNSSLMVLWMFSVHSQLHCSFMSRQSMLRATSARAVSDSTHTQKKQSTAWHTTR